MVQGKKLEVKKLEVGRWKLEDGGGKSHTLSPASRW